jgi:hypothetical protein
MKQWVCLIPILLFFASCKTTAPLYSSNYPLTSERFISRDKVLAGRVPEGWFSSTDDTLVSSLVVWLVKEDYSSVITIRKISTDIQTKNKIDREGLSVLAQVSFSFEKGHSKYAMFRAYPEEFTLRGNRFCSYEVTDGEITKRVVVFTNNRNYYECEVFPTKGKWSEAELSALFVIQQTVLSSLTTELPD